VEGAHLVTIRKDETKHRVHVLENVTRRDAKDTKAVTPKQRVASGVAPRLVAEAVPLSVDLDDKPVLETGEVDGDRSDRKLPSELQTAGTLSKLLPQQNLRQAHLAPQPACALYLLDRCLKDAWATSTMLRMVPLPVPGRI
jgi:hypothetical protein